MGEKFHLITERSRARACFDAFVEALDQLSDRVALHEVAFRPGTVTASTFFFGRLGIWAMLTDGSLLSKSKNRYWNCFGLGGTLASASRSIAIEINHPHAGKSSVSGRFLEAEGSFFVGHTGRIGGGIKNSDAGAIERLTGRPRSEVTIDGRIQKLAFLSRIESTEEFATRLAQFVRGMSNARALLKEQAARRK